jgi:hypothetical protein
MGRIYEDIEPDITIYWDEDLRQWAAFSEEMPEHKAVGATRKDAFESLLNFIEWKKEKDKEIKKDAQREALQKASNLAIHEYGDNSLHEYLRARRRGELFANRRPSLEEVCDWLTVLADKL